MCSSLEQQNLLTRALRKSKSGNGLGGLVIIGRKYIVKACVTDRLHEPFSVFTGQCSSYPIEITCASFQPSLHLYVPLSDVLSLFPHRPIQRRLKTNTRWKKDRGDLHIRTRQPVQRIEAQARILNQNRSTDGSGSSAALLGRDVVESALDLGEVERLVADLDAGRLEDGAHLQQFVGVARYEIDYRLRHLVFLPPFFLWSPIFL